MRKEKCKEVPKKKKKETKLITIQLHCNASTAVIHSTHGCYAVK
jgi:hypothetical protein